jgi:hypothetical protein
MKKSILVFLSVFLVLTGFCYGETAAEYLAPASSDYVSFSATTETRNKAAVITMLTADSSTLRTDLASAITLTYNGVGNSDDFGYKLVSLSLAVYAAGGSFTAEDSNETTITTIAGTDETPKPTDLNITSAATTIVNPGYLAHIMTDDNTANHMYVRISQVTISKDGVNVLDISPEDNDYNIIGQQPDTTESDGYLYATYPTSFKIKINLPAYVVYSGGISNKYGINLFGLQSPDYIAVVINSKISDSAAVVLDNRAQADATPLGGADSILSFIKTYTDTTTFNETAAPLSSKAYGYYIESKFNGDANPRYSDYTYPHSTAVTFNNFAVYFTTGQFTEPATNAPTLVYADAT